MKGKGVLDRSILVRPLAASAEQDLRQVCESYGPVECVRVFHDGFAVDFVSPQDAVCAAEALCKGAGAERFAAAASEVENETGGGGPVLEPLTARLHPFGRGRSAVLVACGSYNPVTVMHLRMLEASREALRDLGWYVTRGVLSPTHQGYGKPGLCDAAHRVRMCELAVGHGDATGLCPGAGTPPTPGLGSPDEDPAVHPARGVRSRSEGRCAPVRDWIQVSGWETEQPAYVRTLPALRHYQEAHPESHVFLAAGADLVASMDVPNVWSPQDVDALRSEFGIVAITRDNVEIESDGAVVAAGERFEFSLSSSAVRELIEEGRSVRYLTPDAVIDYIAEHGLYNHAPSC